MKPFAALTLVLSVLSAVSGQRRRNGRQQQPALAYGAPQQAAAASPQPSYGQPQVQSDQASQGQHDHQGLDWLLESVPGTPGTDYPIYGQEALDTFQFDCSSQVEGGYYADPAADCQAFHVCIPDGLGGLGSQSFLCPNGTIFNQEYFICDWWFNFDCSNAQNLYSRNEEVQAEREQASQAQASNNQNSYAPASQPAQASYGAGK